MAARGEQPGSSARFVYVTRFGSHQCGNVLHLSGPRARGHGQCAPFRGHCGQEEPPGAEVGTRGGEERLPAPERALGAGPQGSVASVSPQRRAWRAQSGCRPTARAGSILKKAAEKYDFPIPLKETSKIMKKKKKEVLWKSVYKVISRMLQENEKYRLRLNSQQLSSENTDYTR
ncbi:PREDICTED: uncharacterized protein C5orf47 homolog [Elephantulus edwardii]|uniref:uncharacterized protein C5orf47 homolog n=1 Tax=Elephantulus edwardii TaxID=28737 RepID=UPI0003F0AD81|nr:PREDICTED: uncharacterized protein C5orf47 homolog [Elephantulus edwardii]